MASIPKYLLYTWKDFIGGRSVSPGVEHTMLFQKIAAIKTPGGWSGVYIYDMNIKIDMQTSGQQQILVLGMQ